MSVCACVCVSLLCMCHFFFFFLQITKKQKHLDSGWALSADDAFFHRAFVIHDTRFAPAGNTYGMGPTFGVGYQALPGINNYLNSWVHVIVSWNKNQTFAGFTNYNQSTFLWNGNAKESEGLNEITIGTHGRYVHTIYKIPKNYFSFFFCVCFLFVLYCVGMSCCMCVCVCVCVCVCKGKHIWGHQ